MWLAVIPIGCMIISRSCPPTKQLLDSDSDVHENPHDIFLQHGLPEVWGGSDSPNPCRCMSVDPAVPTVVACPGCNQWDSVVCVPA
ncbi:hypothetical protein F4677DRAFT_423303 [Hypoxylon crocopeplum]|nr:hypothetical protein F4677DRAFT_423303 [Hypoxylon crocopeplum]